MPTATASAIDHVARRHRLRRMFADTATSAAGGGAALVTLHVESDRHAVALLRRADGRWVEVRMDRALGTAEVRAAAGAPTPKGARHL
jgi:hypothetical protein